MSLVTQGQLHFRSTRGPGDPTGPELPWPRARRIGHPSRLLPTSSSALTFSPRRWRGAWTDTQTDTRSEPGREGGQQNAPSQVPGRNPTLPELRTWARPPSAAQRGVKSRIPCAWGREEGGRFEGLIPKVKISPRFGAPQWLAGREASLTVPDAGPGQSSPCQQAQLGENQGMKQEAQGGTLQAPLREQMPHLRGPQPHRPGWGGNAIPA